MALRLTEQGGEERDGLREARRAVGATRARLEELADRLRELGRRLGNGGSDDGSDDAGSDGGRSSPEVGTRPGTTTRSPF